MARTRSSRSDSPLRQLPETKRRRRLAKAKPPPAPPALAAPPPPQPVSPPAPPPSHSPPHPPPSPPAPLPLPSTPPPRAIAANVTNAFTPSLPPHTPSTISSIELHLTHDEVDLVLEYRAAKAAQAAQQRAMAEQQTPRSQGWGLRRLTSSISRAFSRRALPRISEGSNEDGATPPSTVVASGTTSVGPSPARQAPRRPRRNADERLRTGEISRATDASMSTAEITETTTEDPVVTSSSAQVQSSNPSPAPPVEVGQKRKRAYSMGRPGTYGIPDELFNSSSSAEEDDVSPPKKAVVDKPVDQPTGPSNASPQPPSSAKSSGRGLADFRPRKKVRFADDEGPKQSSPRLLFQPYKPARDQSQSPRPAMARRLSSRSSHSSEPAKERLPPSKPAVAQPGLSKPVMADPPASGSAKDQSRSSKPATTRSSKKTVTLKRAYGPPPGASFGLSDDLLDDSDSDVEVELDDDGFIPEATTGVSPEDIRQYNAGVQRSRNVFAENALARARQEAEKHKPKTPSGLRASTAAESPSPVHASVQAPAQPARVIPPIPPPEQVGGMVIDPIVWEAVTAIPESEYIQYDWPEVGLAPVIRDADPMVWDAVQRDWAAAHQAEV